MLSYFTLPILDSPILPEQRTRLLKPFLAKCYEKLRTISPQFSQLPLTLILKLWDTEDSTFSHSEFDEIRSIVNSYGIEGEKLRSELLTELNQILKEDSHLSVCCGGEPLNFTTAIDMFYLDHLISLSHRINLTESQVKSIYDSFENLLYAGEYKRIAYFHLFNFEIESSEELNFDNWTIETVPQYYIPYILGETTPFSRLHPPNLGNYFLVYKDSESPNDILNWLNSKYEEALEILGLFQYFKDGVIHIDYYTAHFRPNWVNLIWRMGIFFFGRIRHNPIEPKYKILKEEIPKVQKYWNSYKKNHDRFLQLPSSELGKTIQRAGRHFSNYHSKEMKEEQFIDLIIALESLFTPATQEVTYRISQYAGVFLGDQNEGYKIYEFIKEMLSKRGKLFHGQYAIKKLIGGQFLSDEEIKNFASYIRRAILGFIILHLRGENKREEILKKLEMAIFNPEIGEDIRKNANPDNFVNEMTVK